MERGLQLPFPDAETVTCHEIERRRIASTFTWLVISQPPVRINRVEVFGANRRFLQQYHEIAVQKAL